MDKQQIQKQAKEILDKFASALAKVDSEKIDFYVERDEFERKEGDGREYEEGFKQEFLKNSPQHDDDFVIAERGDWEK